MKAALKRLPGAVALAGLLALNSLFAAPPVQSVPQVDLQRYAGTWYELARLPNRFQDQCAGDVTATYAPNPDGSVQVVNRCRKHDGEMSESEGRATPAPGVASNAQLKVSFLPGWLQWLRLGRGDYWVVMLDDDYRYAVVSEPGREYLWILSRTPTLDASTYDGIVDRLRLAGYPVDGLERTPQGSAAAGKVSLGASVRRLVWAVSAPPPQTRAAL